MVKIISCHDSCHLFTFCHSFLSFWCMYDLKLILSAIQLFVSIQFSLAEERSSLYTTCTLIYIIATHRRIFIFTQSFVIFRSYVCVSTCNIVVVFCWIIYTILVYPLSIQSIFFTINLLPDSYLRRPYNFQIFSCWRSWSCRSLHAAERSTFQLLIPFFTLIELVFLIDFSFWIMQLSCPHCMMPVVLNLGFWSPKFERIKV